MVMATLKHMLFKSPSTEKLLKNRVCFLNFNMLSKGIDAVNISIINETKVQPCIPPYFEINSSYFLPLINNGPLRL